jgi:hypothetical protein
MHSLRPSQAQPGIIVLGMGRSGTSVTTHILQASGIHLGPPEALSPADQRNARGYFEHGPLTALNDRVLACLGGDFLRPPDLSSGWESDPRLLPFAHEAQAMIDRLSAQGPWACKDPRLSLLLPFWKPLLPDAKYVICLRNPLAVALSLEDLGPIPIALSSSLWAHCTLQSLKHCPPLKRLLVHYDDFFNNSLATISQLQAFAGATQVDASEVGQSVLSPSLRHHSVGLADLMAEPSIPAEHKVLFAGLLAILSEKGSDPAQQAHAIDALIRTTDALEADRRAQAQLMQSRALRAARFYWRLKGLFSGRAQL